ncbi:MAG: energy transducer TonB [Spirochaetales bacterium]|nr:energy transducer TonB [Spirochaetales bacterium]
MNTYSEHAIEYTAPHPFRNLVRKTVVPVLVIIVYFVLFFTIRINLREKEIAETPDIFKMVDVEVFVPVQPEAEEEKKKPEEETVEVAPQDSVAEQVIETDRDVVEREGAAGYIEEIEYLPQHKVSVAPVMPSAQILENIEYPVLANRQRIEGVVYLELYIDKTGRIRDVIILKDPGYGLGKAAVRALEGIVCEPAMANGQAVAVRYRYPIRFTLK